MSEMSVPFLTSQPVAPFGESENLTANHFNTFKICVHLYSSVFIY
jgi:hypothetical protein